MTVGQRQPEALGPGDDEIHDCPGNRQAGGLAREATNHLCPAPDFLERPFQQVGRAQSLLQLPRVGEGDRQGGKIVDQTGRGRGELGAELADPDAQ
jgi:hypothetical protein